MKGFSLKTNPESMLRDPPLRSIVLFGLPIVFGSVFQQLYNMVDSIVVGNYVGANALAAVGSSGPICNFVVMACNGFGIGASIVVAQQYGADRRQDIKLTISTTLIFAILLSIALSIACMPLLPVFARLTNIPEEIRADAVLYMRVYLGGMIFIMLYNFFAAVLRALGDSVTPLIFLIVSSLLNIVGDLFFVLGLGIGVAGVAIATVLAQFVSVLCCVIYVRKKSEFFAFRKGEFRFSGETFRVVLRIALPSSVQMSIATLSNIFVQSLVNSFNTASIAAYTAAHKMEQLSMLPFGGITQGFGVYVGQNLGAGDMDRMKEGTRKILIFNAIMSICCSALIYAIGPQLIGMFVSDSEVEVIEIGTRYLRIFCPFLILHAMSQIFGQILKGAGDSIFTMASSLSDLGVRFAMAYVFALGCGLGLMGVSWAVPCGWGVSGLVAFLRYLSGKWKTKVVVRRGE